MDAEDNGSDLEATVMKNLSYTSPAPERDTEPASYERSLKPTRKRSKRKSRRANVALPPDTSKYVENLVEVAKHTEERALRLALIRSHGERSKETASPKAPSNDSVVIQAADDKEYIPKRRSRYQHKQNGKDSSSDADAAEIVEKYRREVGRFGSSALHKRARKMYETTELGKLGCRKPKNEKIPIGILVKKRKYQKIREQKKKEMDLATGMLVRTRRK